MTCTRCEELRHLMKYDPHFGAQHYHALILHRLYGVCVERAKGLTP